VTRKWNDLDWWSSGKVRNFILLIFGLAGIAYETIVEQVDRPVLLAIFGGFCGLPIFLNRDEKHPPDERDKPGD
jgi:hypothetical protein